MISRRVSDSCRTDALTFSSRFFSRQMLMCQRCNLYYHTPSDHPIHCIPAFVASI
jgi:hypothetical protein